MTALLLIAVFTLASAGVALALRNLIHSALLLVGSWAGIAAFYLWAGAEFVAFAQVLVYVGAVSMIVLFAVLLTRGSQPSLPLQPDGLRRFIGGLFAGAAVFGVLAGAIAAMDVPAAPGAVAVPVKQLGTELMNQHTAAVLIVGVILTVALLGAVVIAAAERRTPKDT